MAYLIEISSGPQQGERQILSEKHVIVGRSPTCDVTIDDPYVSGNHIEFWSAGDMAFARDLNSSNGSSHNGNSINPADTLTLNSGDRIDLAEGKAIIVVLQEVADAKNTSAPPSGTITFLFSDMYGSTNLVNELGDIKFREISRTHEGVLGDAIRDHDGYIVKEMGDGFMAAFASSRNAVICAMEIQKSLKILRVKQPELPINVRIGLNTGEAILENGDYFGRAVSEAARISSKAEAEQILISSVTKRMADSAGDLKFGEEMEFELKGLPGDHTVFEVYWEE
jgi:class 3 adenylate cyclase